MSDTARKIYLQTIEFLVKKQGVNHASDSTLNYLKDNTKNTEFKKNVISEIERRQRMKELGISEQELIWQKYGVAIAWFSLVISLLALSFAILAYYRP